MKIFESLPKCERPIEKFLYYGEKKLNIAELLAIIINTGTKEKSALEIAWNLINRYVDKYNGIRFLQEISIEELMKIDGIGIKKAIQLKTVGELTKRMMIPAMIDKICVKSSSDIANIFMQELRYEKQEVVKVILLNANNTIKKVVDIASGNANKVTFDIKQILSEPIKLEVPKIILIHNHPSGNTEPSNEDIMVTERIKNAASIMGIEFVDHIIIGDGEYKSII